MSHLPRGDAHAAAAAAAAPRAARGAGSRVTQPETRRGRAEWLRLAIVALLVVYAVCFVILNTRHVRVSFVLWSTKVSVIWVILLSLGVGLALGVLLPQLRRHRQRRG